MLTIVFYFFASHTLKKCSLRLYFNPSVNLRQQNWIKCSLLKLFWRASYFRTGRSTNTQTYTQSFWWGQTVWPLHLIKTLKVTNGLPTLTTPLLRSHNIAKFASYFIYSFMHVNVKGRNYSTGNLSAVIMYQLATSTVGLTWWGKSNFNTFRYFPFIKLLFFTCTANIRATVWDFKNKAIIFREKSRSFLRKK